GARWGLPADGGPSARSAALSGAVTALPGSDPATLYANPALLAPEAEGQLSLGYLNHLSDVNAGFATYARDVRGVGRLALGVRYLSYGEFERSSSPTDIPVEGPTTYGASEAAVTLGYAHDVNSRVRLGAAVHALFESVDDARGQAFAADAGVTYSVPSQLLMVSASVHGIGAVSSSLGADTARLPLDVRVGVSKRLRYLPLTFSVSGHELQNFENEEGGSALDEALRHVAAGGELQLGKALALRAGYSPGRAEGLRTGERLDLAGLNLGFGIATRRVTIDYARIGWGTFGGLHQLGVRVGL
ncbi:MAG: PorV/PorQ family protein, partial [Bacteroidota bacterium]